LSAAMYRIYGMQHQEKTKFNDVLCSVKRAVSIDFKNVSYNCIVPKY
jgi:hypothetical protein